MSLILDTSALIHFFFGTTQTSKKIKNILSQYKHHYITQIIKYEFRNIFLDFFLFIDIYNEIIAKIKEGKISIVETFSELLEEISRRYYYRTQQFGRLRMLYQNIFVDYNKEIFDLMTQGFFSDNNNLYNILIDRLETIIWDYKMKLFVTQEKLTSFSILSDFDCPLANWSYEYQPEINQFSINEKRTCSQICNDLEAKISKFTRANTEYINKILNSKMEKMEYDKKAINIIEKIVKKKDYTFGIKDCKKLGDFFICSVINDHFHLLTRNEKHFRFFLTCKDKGDSLILF